MCSYPNHCFNKLNVSNWIGFVLSNLNHHTSHLHHLQCDYIRASFAPQTLRALTLVSAWSPRHPINCEYPVTVLNGVRIFQSTKLCLAKLKCVCTIERCPSLAHHHMFNMCLHCHIHVLYLYIICNYTWIMTMSGAIHEPLKHVPLGHSCGSWETVQPWIIYVSNWIGFAKLQWDQEDGL